MNTKTEDRSANDTAETPSDSGAELGRSTVRRIIEAAKDRMQTATIINIAADISLHQMSGREAAEMILIEAGITLEEAVEVLDGCRLERVSEMIGLYSANTTITNPSPTKSKS